MKMINPIIGLILIAGIIYAGYYSTSHSNFIIWFGVITALISPLAFELLFYPLKSKDKSLLQSLSKVPQIEKLMDEAKDNESKIKLLEQQRIELDKIISFETERRTLLAERRIYIIQGEIALKQINKLNDSLGILTKEKQALPNTSKSLQAKIESINVNDIIYSLCGKRYILRKELFESIPIYGLLIFEILRLISQISKDVEN